MKNLHLIPTGRPSSLYIGDNGSFVFGMIKTSTQSRNDDFTNQHIYITSDEEIEEGDWFTDDNNSLKRSYRLSHVQFANPKKIILTTDPYLISEGVQAIDDEFLEWFVQNPSCEEIKTDLVPVNEFGSEITVGAYGFDKFIYKIIIPQEEPKQETVEEADERMFNEKDMKQFAWQCVGNFLSNRDNEVEEKLVEVIIDRNNLEFEKFKKK